MYFSVLRLPVSHLSLILFLSSVVRVLSLPV